MICKLTFPWYIQGQPQKCIAAISMVRAVIFTRLQLLRYMSNCWSLKGGPFILPPHLEQEKAKQPLDLIDQWKTVDCRGLLIRWFVLKWKLHSETGIVTREGNEAWHENWSVTTSYFSLGNVGENGRKHRIKVVWRGRHSKYVALFRRCSLD